jgi:4-hydroxybenzoate polyprenyltransferase/phosphoserine phosphatase
VTITVHPLVVDLDGTLLRSDLLFETAVAYVRHRPLQITKPFMWLSQGKARLKEGLAEATDIDVKSLPYNPLVIEFINREKASGRRVVLATASHESLAQKIAEHTGLFDEVIATNNTVNLTARHKRDELVRRYGEQGFDYMGNSHDDIIVWRSARFAYVINPDRGVEQKAMQGGNVMPSVSKDRAGYKDWLRALRLHQWMKNALIFVPLLAAHELSNVELIAQALLAFVFFGICASSVYILNDILDLADDRHHSKKRHRPFAAGTLSIKSGILAFPILLAIAFGGAAIFLDWAFSLVLAAYYVLTLAYSMLLKRKMAVDVIALAMLYTVRIIAGAFACGLELTFWILAFSMFIFLSLALVKRYAELHENRKKGLTERTRGRGYYPADLEILSSLGASSGYLSVMVLALYIHEQSSTSLYAHPQLIWLACPLLLFWITRVWVLTHRGEMHDDPVVFAIRDRASLMMGLMFCTVFWMAT